MQTQASGGMGDGLGGQDAGEAADEFGVAAFEADMRQYTQQVPIHHRAQETITLEKKAF